jgi:AcrR family transcriptional regulator
MTPERRRQQTREYLLAAAAEVFAERGFYGATLDEVAAVAGFTKGAVYSNFKSKDDLFLALLESRYESGMSSLRAYLDATAEPHQAVDFLDRITAELDDAASNAWGPLYQEFLVYAMRNPEARAKLAERERADVESLAELLAAERKRHGIEDTQSVEHAARFVIALTRGLITMRLIEQSQVDEGVVAAILDLLERALRPGPINPGSGPAVTRR